MFDTHKIVQNRIAFSLKRAGATPNTPTNQIHKTLSNASVYEKRTGKKKELDYCTRFFLFDVVH